MEPVPRSDARCSSVISKDEASAAATNEAQHGAVRSSVP